MTDVRRSHLIKARPAFKNVRAGRFFSAVRVDFPPAVGYTI